jgi:hypothetical protein
MRMNSTMATSSWKEPDNAKRFDGGLVAHRIRKDGRLIWPIPGTVDRKWVETRKRIKRRPEIPTLLHGECKSPFCRCDSESPVVLTSEGHFSPCDRSSVPGIDQSACATGTCCVAICTARRRAPSHKEKASQDYAGCVHTIFTTLPGFAFKANI